MQVDKQQFPMNTLGLGDKKVLVWPKAAEASKGKAVIIGPTRTIGENSKIFARVVIKTKTTDGKSTFKIISRFLGTRGQQN